MQIPFLAKYEYRTTYIVLHTDIYILFQSISSNKDIQHKTIKALTALLDRLSLCVG